MAEANAKAIARKRDGRNTMLDHELKRLATNLKN
jgi:hypothetical protein